MKYVKSFDGIRGWGMLMLFTFHPGYLPGVWPMIQLFFILSGYLISKILLEDKGSPFRDYLARYLWRRTLRIFPLYFFVVFLAIGVYALFGVPAETGEEWPYMLTYSMNFARARPQDVGEWFVHFWSLAAEEQFYLVWPLVIYFVPKELFKKLVIALVALSPLVKYAVFVFLDGENHLQLAGRMIYSLPFTQLDAFALGSFVAVYQLEGVKNLSRWCWLTFGTYFGLGFVMLIYQHYHGGMNPLTLGYPIFMVRHNQYLWGYTLINLMMVVTLLATIQRLWLARIVFEWEPFVRLGRISYGCYIYHLPIMRITQIGMEELGFPVKGFFLNVVFFVTYVGLTIVVAALSFKYLESPFLTLKAKFQPRKAHTPVKEQRAAA